GTEASPGGPLCRAEPDYRSRCLCNDNGANDPVFLCPLYYKPIHLFSVLTKQPLAASAGLNEALPILRTRPPTNPAQALTTTLTESKEQALTDCLEFPARRGGEPLAVALGIAHAATGNRVVAGPGRRVAQVLRAGIRIVEIPRDARA